MPKIKFALSSIFKQHSAGEMVEVNIQPERVKYNKIEQNEPNKFVPKNVVETEKGTHIHVYPFPKILC